MTYPIIDGGGGGTPGKDGTSLELGPTQNLFGNLANDADNVSANFSPATSKANAEIQRNLYFTNNPDKLAEYDANRRLNIILAYTTGIGVTTSSNYQNRVGGAWVDAPIALSLKGDKGDAGQSLTEVPITILDSPYDASEGESITVSLNGNDIVINLPDSANNFATIRIKALVLIGANKLIVQELIGGGIIVHLSDGSQQTDTGVEIKESIQRDFQFGGTAWDLYLQ